MPPSGDGRQVADGTQNPGRPFDQTTEAASGSEPTSLAHTGALLMGTALEKSASKAFEAFFRSEYTSLLRVAIYAGASEDEAHETVQESMLEAYRKWATIENPRAWTCKAVVNNFIKVKRRNAERLARTLAGGHLTSEIDDRASLTVWEDTQWVSQLLDQLPPAQRVIMAYIIDGWRPAEVAYLLGKTPVAIRKNLQLARRRLKAELARRHEQERHLAANYADEATGEDK